MHLYAGVTRQIALIEVYSRPKLEVSSAGLFAVQFANVQVGPGGSVVGPGGLGGVCLMGPRTYAGSEIRGAHHAPRVFVHNFYIINYFSW